MMKILFVSVFLLIFGVSIAEKKIVCYYGTWATYRHSVGKFDVSNINPFLCTHLIYTFFGVEENGDFRVIDPYLDLEDNWGRGNIKKFNDLKKINPKLKTLAAVGGWNEGSYKFSQVAQDSIKRQRFINSSVNFILKHGFDGLDLDWEYPGQRDGDPNIDKLNYIKLLRELKPVLSKHNLLLTAAVASVEYSAKISYNIAEISKYLDFINVMSYDLHGSWDNVVGINAPLYASPADLTEKEKQLNVDSIVSYWLSQGAPAEKLIIGLPFYGRTFTLNNPLEADVGAINNGAGLPGPYTNEPGMIGYNELCEKLLKESWIKKWEYKQKVPYVHKNNQWIGYDNVTSVGIKTQYVLNKKLGGIMIWSVETDDFRGVCGETYPLLKEINRKLGNDIHEVPTTPAPATSTASPSSSASTTSPSASTASPSSPTTPSQGNGTSTQQPSIPEDSECYPDGMFRDKNDCSSFYVCTSGKLHKFRCPGNLVFDENINICNYPHLVDC